MNSSNLCISLNHEDVLSSTIELVQQRFPEAKNIGPRTSFSADLALDSLQVMELVTVFEAHFGIEIPLEVLFQVGTIEDVANLLILQEP